MTNLSEIQPATFESIRATLQETDRVLSEKFAKTDRMLSEKFAETDRLFKESDRKFEITRIEAEKRMKKLEELMGSWSNNHGFFAEEYFVNSFEQNQRNFFGEKFDEIEKNVKGIKKNFKDEYDILLFNCKSIGIIEVKFKAHINDVPKILRKAETFKVNFPEYQNHQIYLGLATMVFYEELEQECISQGIAVIKQVGDTIVINDAHLKVF